MANPTTNVWISAIAAVSSELLANQDSTIACVSNFECGPISWIEAPSSRTLATNSSNKQPAGRAATAVW